MRKRIRLLIIAGHNAVGPLLMSQPSEGAVGAFFKVLYVGFFNGPIQLWPGGPELTVLYSIIPWIGVLAAGFGFGAVMIMDPPRRRTLCLRVGVGAVALFLVLRGFNLYSDPRPWSDDSGMPARCLTVFGRVPMYYYLLHIPLIHLLALGVSQVRLGLVHPWLFANHPMGNPEPPEGYTWGLGLLYAVWLLAVALLYLPCRWFGNLKARRKDWWLSYL